MQPGKITDEHNMNQTEPYRWIVYGCLAAAYFLAFFHRLSLGVVKDDLTASFHMSATAFASLSAMYFYAYMIMQIPTGILADTVSPRIIVTLGSLVSGLGTIIFALSPTVGSIFIGRFLLGLGVSVVYVCLLKICTQWFQESEFGTMVGLTGFIGNIGGMVGQTPLAILLALFSWRYIFVTIGLISLALAILCFMLVRDQPPNMEWAPISEAVNREENTREAETVAVGEGILGVIRNYRTWLIFIVLACYSGVYYTFAGTWGVSYIKAAYRLNNVQASEYITVLILGISLGYLIMGLVSDRLKSRKIPLVFSGILVNVLWLALLYSPGGCLTKHLLPVVMLIMGISTACYSLSFSLSKEVNNPRYAGMAVSVVNVGAFVGGAVVPILVGSVLDRYQGVLVGLALIRKGLLVCLVINAFALLASMLIKETGCRNIYFGGQGRG